jgi:hypothetical protein
MEQGACDSQADVRTQLTSVQGLKQTVGLELPIYDSVVQDSAGLTSYMINVTCCSACR